jgi:hypothetical protein
MKRTRPHPNRSTLLSNDPQDKRCACLNHAWTDGAYALAPDYFDACARRWSKLYPEQMEAAEDMISFNDRPDAVEQIAPYLTCRLRRSSRRKHWTSGRTGS